MSSKEKEMDEVTGLETARWKAKLFDARQEVGELVRILQWLRVNGVGPEGNEKIDRLLDKHVVARRKR